MAFIKFYKKRPMTPPKVAYHLCKPYSEPPKTRYVNQLITWNIHAYIYPSLSTTTDEKEGVRRRRCVQPFKRNSVNVYWHLLFTDHWPFCPSFIESASKVNLEYCHPWVLVSFLNNYLKFQSTFHHSIAPNLWRFWPRVSPVHAFLFQLIVGRCSLQIKLCSFTMI